MSRERISARQIVLATLLALCAVGVLALVFLPIGWQLNRFVVWLYYELRGIGIFVPLEAVDAGLNVLLFAVPTALAAMLWPKVRWWVWPVVMLACSTGIELVQYFALPRDASVWDVVTNTAGALVGSGLIALLRLRRAGAAPTA